MVDDSGALQPLSDSELAELDAKYRPFPAFPEWSLQTPGLKAWDAAKEELDRVAAEARPEDIEHGRQIAMRAAAFDTGAIEGLYSTNRGLTFSVAEQSAAWEQEVDAQGPSARALFEAQLKAFELVLDHVTKRVPQVTQAWLRRIHEEITTPQETYLVHTPVGSREQALPRGEYKRYPNHVRTAAGGVHAYAPVADTPAEMDRLLRELETPEFGASHPIVQASYAHYGLVAVHPFADGNGRVSRALASVFTYRAASVPLLVLDEHRDRYFHTLSQADGGDVVPFVDFVATAGRETLDLVRDALRTAMAPQPEAVLEKFGELARAREESKELDMVLDSFSTWLQKTAKDQVARLHVPPGVQIVVQPAERRPRPRGRDLRGADRSVRILCRTAPPARASVPRQIDVSVSEDSLEGPKVMLAVAQLESERLTFDLADISPRLSAVAEHRLENLLRRTLGDGLDALHRKVARGAD